MAGAIIPLWSARDFDLSSLAMNTSTVFDVGPPRPMLPYRDALFLLRVHSVTITGTASLSFSVHPAAPTPDDPAGTFVDQSVVSLAIAGSASGELLRTPIAESAFGTHVQVRATAMQPKTSAETIQARISAVLVGRR